MLDTCDNTDRAFGPCPVLNLSVFLLIFGKLTDTNQQSSTFGSRGGQCRSVTKFKRNTTRGQVLKAAELFKEMSTVGEKF